MNELNNKKGSISTVIIVILLAVIIGLGFYIACDKGLIFDNNNNKNQELPKIEVTTSLEERLRLLIPTIEYCNRYLFKQYNGVTFKNSDLTQEDKTSDFNECQGALFVENLSYKVDSTEDEIYLYDYVLLYDMQSSSFGKNYKNIDIKSDNIEFVYYDDGTASAAESSIKKYGQIYKYTFKLVNNNYEYISTEAVFE